MISSSRSNSAGLQLALHTFSGARSARVIGGGNSVVPEHSHDWPVLSLYVMGDYSKAYDGGDIRISGPSAIFHGSREAHSNSLGEVGLEQIDLQFDPAWLGRRGVRPSLDGVRCWIGGPVAAAASRLASLWSDPASDERKLVVETRQFLSFAIGAPAESGPAWLDDVSRRLRIGRPPTAMELGRDIGLHPTWLAQAYRKGAGEGLRQTLQRRRVEYATRLLREFDLPAAEVAADAGFCDQSHMNRAFRAMLDRTPAQVRAERAQLIG